MSFLLRRIHLYLALFLAPWILMYAASTFVMNHRELFHGPPPVPPPRFELERESVYAGELPANATPKEIALQILGSLELDGAYSVNGPANSATVVINRLDPITPRRITYAPESKMLKVEKLVYTNTAFLERMHRRRGFQHDYVLEDLWAASVDLTILALLVLAGSGIWMWWELKTTRRMGALALAGGIALFALFLGVL